MAGKTQTFACKVESLPSYVITTPSISSFGWTLSVVLFAKTVKHRPRENSRKINVSFVF